MGSGSSKNKTNLMCENALDQSPVFVPFESLTKPVIDSLVYVATTFQKPNHNYSERTILRFLLEIKNQLERVETTIKENKIASDDLIVEQVKRVREWLVDRNQEPLAWNELQSKYDKIANDPCRKMAKYYGSEDSQPYFELTVKTHFADVENSRRYIEQFRKEGFKLEELKVYWNFEQIENLNRSVNTAKPKYDKCDVDVIENLRKYPVRQRNNKGDIEYITNGIEKAVFDVPKDSQIILLNFANEQSPGGGYLRNARAQEEVLLYNSDAYRALLDLKYKRMAGGYAIPEFGLAYVKNIKIFESKAMTKHRCADMLVSACYCMIENELYPNPLNENEWREKNLAKFRAFMAAAVANTQGNGDNTYLLLGPIGTGAFGNDVDEIGHVFRKVLQMKMMNSDRPIRYAFQKIWFVSIDEWKNECFKKIIEQL